VRQLRHPQASARDSLAREETADHAALHPDLTLLAEHGRDLFGIITRQAIRRGTYRCVKDLITAIGVFIDGWNNRCQPFTWTKTADELLPYCKPGKRTSFTRH
jgi:hypothetical protein